VIGGYTGNRFADADRQHGGAAYRIQHFDTRRR